MSRGLVKPPASARRSSYSARAEKVSRISMDARRGRLEGVKPGIHPDYGPSHVRCTCGNEFWTRSTKPELHVEICSNCHPFYTGKQKLVDSGGRVERFQRRLERAGGARRG